MSKSINSIRNELSEIHGQLLALVVAIQSEDSKAESTLQQLIIRLDFLLRELAAHHKLAHNLKWNYPHGSTDRWNKDQRQKDARACEQTALSLKAYIQALLNKGHENSMVKGEHLIHLGEDADELVGHMKSGHTEIPSHPVLNPWKDEIEAHVFQSSLAVAVTLFLVSKWAVGKSKAKI